MTWSITAHDPETGAFAVAVATCNFAVGASCPFVRAGVGAVSTQSMTNRYLGPAILDGMARGLTPAAAIEGALASDPGRGIRQVHAVDRHGSSAAWTGENCVEWCGHMTAEGFSVAGNMLAGEAVVAECFASFATGATLELPERLMAAMEAGERAGGDRRGRQSAAMVMVTTEDFPDLDIRVDDHPDPLAELRRLLGIWTRDRKPGLPDSPRKANPAGRIDLDRIEAGWRARGLDLRFRR
ncbi:DUF1028 domain-containing protein [Siccirubricoccus sp. KC 17139]|uniref:DUF1028 domain-containing protein n=1 Tax=Siccirubricoccus soli TaxID=2899147 RepID=A0ABT1D572_9PROT|nr:DUF1028 domain-containing protein [Siccirubricoccus soli]MCO6417046.1 DUF1028 domain-containing protein [Siccirubricoccus soli]MCP2683181.1 DUF1028 domain-containing protein [Siccirubricoccus soli]